MNKYVFGMLMGTLMAADENDRFTKLPGASENMSTASYSGYLPINEEKELHYVYVESETDPENDPVLIWFNGGPGCSSLLGFMQEHGPWIIDDGETEIKKNPYPWNLRANVLYIESPAGVGYSIARDKKDMVFNDISQSEDAYKALMQWFEKFPERLYNPLYVSGESYGGIYVPYLSWQIHESNTKSEISEDIPYVNLKGFLVGNGATNWDFDVTPSFPETLYNFNLIPHSLMQNYTQNGCIEYFNDFRPGNGTEACAGLMDQMQTLTEDLNWYDLYRAPTDVLSEPRASSEERYGARIIDGEEHPYKRGYTFAEYTPWLKNHPAQLSERVFGSAVTDYINSEEFRTALHISDEVQVYEECSGEVGSNYHYQQEGSEWIYRVLKDNGIKMMHYSGDTDGAVTTYGTKRWIKTLGWEVKKAWRPWKTDAQVSGFIEEYDGLDFVTVKGVGHMAPQWARKPVQDMITAWIHDETF